MIEGYIKGDAELPEVENHEKAFTAILENMKSSFDNRKPEPQAPKSTRPFYKTSVMTMNSVEQFPIGHLRNAYEEICNEYRRRINEQWDLDIKDSWWIPSDRIGMTLALCDLEYSLGMEDVRLMVDLNVSYEDFNEWWNHCLGDTKYHINAFNWFVNGARPKDLKE